MGKKSDINKEEFEKLCAILCTKEEIAGFFNVSQDTLFHWCMDEYGKTFQEVFADKSAYGKISLRRYQFRQAEVSAQMAIWLGKQLLGQKDTKDNMDESDRIQIVNDVEKDE